MKLKILHLENSFADAVLVGEELKNSPLEFEIKLVDTRKDFIETLNNFSPDVILSDHSINSFDSLEALKIVKEKKLNTPFILVTDLAGKVFSENAKKYDRFNHISKNELKRLPGAILSAISKKHDHQSGKHKSEVIETKIKSDEALRQMADRLLLATTVCKLGIWDWDIINNEMIWDRLMYEHYGLKPVYEKITHNTWQTKVHSEDLVRVRDEIQLALSGEKEYDVEFRVIWPDKSVHYIKEVGTVQKDIYGRAIRMLATNQDVTRQKIKQEEFIKNKLKLEKEKAQVILLAQEKEREKIGYELHDNVNQVLASAKMYIDLIKANNKEQKTIKSKSREYLFIAMEEIRKLSKQLVVSHIDHIGLIGSIEGLVTDITDLQLFNIEFTCEDEEIENLASLKRIALFRILQEQLKNIVAYSRAKNVAVDLKILNGIVILSIKDDGIGFDAAKPRKGLGLSHIFELTDLYYGHADVKTAPGEGCALTISIPFN